MNEDVTKLLRLFNELSGRVSRLELMFEKNREQNGKIIAELAKEIDEIKNPDIQYKIVRR